MEETEYHQKASPALAELLEFLEELEENHDIEPELEGGILSIIMPDDKEYVINKHTPSRQIWVSSPYSGASYFHFVDEKWVLKRGEIAQNQSLFGFIQKEIMSHLDT